MPYRRVHKRGIGCARGGVSQRHIPRRRCTSVIPSGSPSVGAARRAPRRGYALVQRVICCQPGRCDSGAGGGLRRGALTSKPRGRPARGRAGQDLRNPDRRALPRGPGSAVWAAPTRCRRGRLSDGCMRRTVAAKRGCCGGRGRGVSSVAVGSCAARGVCETQIRARPLRRTWQRAPGSAVSTRLCSRQPVYMRWNSVRYSRTHIAQPRYSRQRLSGPQQTMCVMVTSAGEPCSRAPM